MHWTSGQVDQYFSSPEYLDTAVVPCYRIVVDEKYADLIKSNEEYMAKVLELEDRLKGRIVLFPALVFYSEGNYGEHVKQSVEHVLRELQKFKHILFVPLDTQLQNAMQNELDQSRCTILSIEQQSDWYNIVLSLWTKN